MSSRAAATPLLSALTVGLLYLAILALLRFHLCLNDFWAWSFLASRASYADPSSFWNGFMPPGYVLFLKAIGPQRELAGAFALTLLGAAATAGATVAILRAAKQDAPAWVAVLLLAIFPPFLASGLTAGPDIVVTALVTGAALLHIADPSSRRRGLLAGLLLGLATLVRSHAAFAGLGILVGVAAVDRRLGRGGAALAIGLATGVAAQVALNLVTGHGPWANAQAFNVYKMVYGMDWYDPIDPASVSVGRILAEVPLRFLREWAGAFLRAGIWLAGPAMALLFARNRGRGGLARLAAIVLLAGLVYTVPVSLGDSPRTAVVLSALLVAPTAALVDGLRRAGPQPRTLLWAAVIAWGVVVSLGADLDFLRHNFRQSRDFAAVEAALRADGAQRARTVFTDDFDLYFRELEGRRPLTRGGWGLVGIEGWADTFVQLPIGSRSLFLESCREHGVRYLALTRRVRRVSPALLELRRAPEEAGLRPLGAFGEFVLVAIE